MFCWKSIGLLELGGRCASAPQAEAAAPIVVAALSAGP